MNTSQARPGTIRASLRYPAFRWLLGGLAVSQLGDWLYNLALIALVYDRTHSALWAGITTAARVIPIVALGPLGGVVADRFVITHAPILLAPLIAAAATAVATPYLPCVAATTPRLVDGADLPGANAARSAVNGIAIIAGPALGGVLLLLGSPALAFLLNAVTFGLAALAVLAIPAGQTFRPARSGERPAGVLRGVADGAAALRSCPGALRLVGADIACSTIYGTQTVLLLLVSRSLGMGAHGYGYLFAGIGAGALAGTALAGRVQRWGHPRYVLAGALCAVGLPMPLLAVAHLRAGPARLAGRDRRGLADRAAARPRAGRDRGAGGPGAGRAGLRTVPAPPGARAPQRCRHPGGAPDRGPGRPAVRTAPAARPGPRGGPGLSRTAGAA
jgi:Transmembrane secretion effector